MAHFGSRNNFPTRSVKKEVCDMSTSPIGLEKLGASLSWPNRVMQLFQCNILAGIIAEKL